jgi:hypothetical protein
MVNPIVEAEGDAFARKFAQAQRFRHVVIDNFLESDPFRRLMMELPAFDEQKAKNEMGQIGRKAVVPDLSAIGQHTKHSI